MLFIPNEKLRQYAEIEVFIIFCAISFLFITSKTHYKSASVTKLKYNKGWLSFN